MPEDGKPSLFNNLLPALLLSPEALNRQKDEDLTLLREGNHSFTYEIHPDDTLESLQQVRLNSQNNFTFSLTNSPLMESLVNGVPVILGNLACNPALAASLETLLLPNPYLFIHGNKVDLPDAQVILIRPAERQTTSSPLINHLLSASPDNQREPPSENPIYLLLKSLPRAYQKNYPDTPPWRSDTFEYQLNRQIAAEQQSDGSNELKPCHKHCALHVVLAKPYRGNSAVYSYIKAKIVQYYPDEVTEHRSDRSALQQWLTKQPIIDMESIKKDFWILARHCPVDVYASINKIDEIDEDSLNRLATHLVGAADTFWQTTLAYRLEVDLTLAREQSFFDGVMRSTLRDALIANKASLKPGTVISKTVTLLEEKIAFVLARTQSDQQKAEEIKEILALYFQGGRLPDGYQNLPDSLLTHQRHTRAKQQRRLARLTDLIQLHPIVYLQGEAGAGKTFMAKAVSEKAGYSSWKVIPLNLHPTPDELFGGQQLKRYTVDNKTDHVSEFHQGPLLEWASSNHPELLLLDEANLASEGLLSPLVGLLRERPELHYQGNKYPLTDKHRIIMTGNREHYAGRHLDKALQSRIPTLFYPPLQESVLADSIILPNLPDWPSVQKQEACKRIIKLFNGFKDLLPGDLVTPRDIKDVLAIVHQILRYRSAQLDSITQEQINALIRRAFMDSLAGAVSEDYQQRLNSLNDWCQGQFPEDLSVMTNMDQAFDAFVKQLQAANIDADCSSDPIRQLVYHYWQTLDKGEGGRVVLLVEGPTGWGKDFVLDKTIKLWQQQQIMKSRPIQPFVHINANPNQLAILIDRLTEAMDKWVPFAISEFNLLSSQAMERLINDQLTDDAKQGFRLFVTINPNSFEGRETLSPALKSHCTQVKLRALSRPVMEGLVQRLPDIPGELPQWLVGHFHQLSTALDDQQSSVWLTLDDLLNTAKDLASKDSNQWKNAFRQHLSLQFFALTKDTLPTLEEERVRFVRECAEEQHRLECEKGVNSLLGLSAPITVKFDNLPNIGDQEVTVKPNETAAKVISEVVEFGLKNSKVNDDKTVKVKSAATCVKRSSRGRLCELSAIEEARYYEIICYFPKDPYSYHYYRLRVEEVRLDEEGELRTYSIDWQNGSIADVDGWPESTSWRTDLREDELPGYIVLTLNDCWQSLPSLTPSDELRAIRCAPPTTDIQLARCQATGLLLIKYQGPTAIEVRIDFIIAPEQTYFTHLKPEDSLLIQEGLCCQRFKTLLDENIFNASGDICQAYQELRTIHQIDDISQRLNALMDWLNEFSSDKNITGEGEDMFLNLLRKKQGVCVHKSIILGNLCHYWGLPARQVSNVSHMFVEVSPDGGNTWRQYELGGGGQGTYSIDKQNWDESHHRLASSKLRSPADRVSLAKNDSDSDSDSDNITTLATKKLLREIKKTFVKNQPLSNTMLKSLKACFEQTFREIEEDKRYFILNLVNNIFLFFEKEHDYIDCLFHLCEISDYVKHEIIGFVQNLIKNHSVDKSDTHRMQRILSTMPSFISNMEIKNAEKPLTNPAYVAARSLPKSKYLEGKISHVKINKTCTRAPKTNSHMSFEKMAAGLPAFVNHSTLKGSKSVIIDLHDIDEVLRQQNEEYVNNNMNTKNKLFHIIANCKSDQSTINNMLDIFFCVDS